MSAFVAGGMSHREDWTGTRLWAVDNARRFSWQGLRDERGFVPAPVPGEARVVAADPYGDPWVVLNDGDAYRWKTKGAPMWVRQGNVFEGQPKTRRHGMHEENKVGARIAFACVERANGTRRLVAVTESRELVSIADGAEPRKVGPPIPGDAAVLAATVDGPGATALLDDGRVLHLSPQGWFELSRIDSASINGEPVLVTLRALVGFRYEKGKLVEKGGVFEVPTARALELIGRGVAEPMGSGS